MVLLANRWFVFGLFSIIVGIALIIFFGLIDNQNIVNNWIVAIIWIIRGAVVTFLIVSMSKYAFNTAKSYMDVSIKYGDRQHALRFGNFFVKIFSPDVSKKDLKEVFQNWNVDNRSVFSSLDSDKFDPRIADVLIEGAKAVASKKDAEEKKPEDKKSENKSNEITLKIKPE